MTPTDPATMDGPTKDGPRKTPRDPLYQQLLDRLRRDVLEGRLPPGTRLPSEGELSARNAVSRHTVREALRRLGEEGLVAPRKGSGTVVVARDGPAEYVHQIASVEELLAYAADVPLHVALKRRLRAGRNLARRVGYANGQDLLLIAGLRQATGQRLPVCWTEVYIPAAYAGITATVGETVGAIWTQIERMHGRPASDIEQVITARPIPDRLAKRLAVEAGSPGIEMRRTFRYGAAGIKQVAINLHPADRFVYAINLKRTRAAP